jgi:outer membrane protein assembly factor BamB
MIVYNVGMAADWSQWHGPNRDNISTEKNLLERWPETGPNLIWSIDGLGDGYSTVSKVGRSIYITGMVEKEGMLSKIDLTGQLIWQKPYGLEWNKSFPGSRSTATIHKQNAYVMSGMGNLVCLDSETGEVKWSLNTFEKFNGKLTPWGVAESILVDNEKLFCMAGGANASIIALDKNNGDFLWATKELSERVAFCSPILVDHHGKKQLVTVLPESVVGIDIENGKLLWKCPTASFRGPDAKPHGLGSTANTPVYRDGCVYVSTGYDFGGAKLKISEDSSTATIVWKNYDLDNHHGGVLLIENYLYGSGWNGNAKGDWFCIDWSTGKTIYSYNWDNNKGSVSYADGMLYCYAERSGTVALVKAVPTGFEIISSIEITNGEGEHWAHPVILDGVLYIRHGDSLMAYDIRAK